MEEEVMGSGAEEGATEVEEYLQDQEGTLLLELPFRMFILKKISTRFVMSLALKLNVTLFFLLWFSLTAQWMKPHSFTPSDNNNSKNINRPHYNKHSRFSNLRTDNNNVGLQANIKSKSVVFKRVGAIKTKKIT
jgi:hypothetical protein